MAVLFIDDEDKPTGCVKRSLLADYEESHFSL